MKGKKMVARIKAKKVGSRGKILMTKNKAGKVIEVKFAEEAGKRSNTVGNTRKRERKALREASPACDYERIRAANIAERVKLLRTLDIEADKNSLAGLTKDGPSTRTRRTLARRSTSEWGVAKGTLVERLTSGRDVAGKKGCSVEEDEKRGEPSTRARRTLARRSTSEWGVAGKKGCSVEVGDVVKQEQEEDIEEDTEGEVMEGGEVVKGEMGGEVDPLALPLGRDAMDQAAVEAAVANDVEEIGDVGGVEEVAVQSMEIPNSQVDQATFFQEEGGSVQTRREEELENGRHRVRMDVAVNMEGEKQSSFLDSAKIAKRKIETLKHEEEMKRVQLQNLNAKNLEDTKRSSVLAKTEADLLKRKEELQKRKTELEMMLQGVEEERSEIQKEKNEIVQRQKKRDAKAADLHAEIMADERIKLAKEEELKKVQAEVQAALLLFQAAAPSK